MCQFFIHPRRSLKLWYLLRLLFQLINFKKLILNLTQLSMVSESFLFFFFFSFIQINIYHSSIQAALTLALACLMLTAVQNLCLTLTFLTILLIFLMFCIDKPMSYSNSSHCTNETTRDILKPYLAFYNTYSFF